MCSASKVKCNKEKPICSRCYKLSYPCFYSPARRIGRPHPSRGKSSRGKPELGADPSERQPLNRLRDESGGSESNVSSDDGPTSQEYQARATTINNVQMSENDFFSDAVFDFRSPATSQTENFPQMNPYIVPEAHQPRRKHHVGEHHMGDMALFNSDDQVNRANASEVDGLFCQAISRGDINTLLPTPSTNSSSTSSNFDNLSEVLAFGEGSASNASEHDCVMVATSMLQDLNMTCMQRPSGPALAGKIETPTLDALINTTSIAMKRVSTILVCPCSQKVEVGLLVAAVCATTLDVYGIILRNSSSSNTHRFSMDKPTYASMSSVNDAVMDPDMMEIGTQPLQDGPSEEETIMRILEKLPQVANLVRQFSKRYSEDVEESSADFLPLLTGSLKSRLKSMTNETTNWLAHI